MDKTLLKKQYEIDKVFLEKPWKHLTYSEIQKISKKKSKWFIYKELNRLEENKMIKLERIGKRSVVYYIKLDTASSQAYWGFIAEYVAWNKDNFPHQLIENLRSKMPTPFFSLIVTGSYAKGEHKLSSDLDVIIISDLDPKSIYASLKYEAETSIPKVHLYVFTKKEFLDMLFLKKENYGKEAVRNNLIFFGGAQYYSLLSEAISNGFKG
jgi:predicted nucleotidyltransferase